MLVRRQGSVPQSPHWQRSPELVSGFDGDAHRRKVSPEPRIGCAAPVADDAAQTAAFAAPSAALREETQPQLLTVGAVASS
jgi:hypothetical protein